MRAELKVVLLRICSKCNKESKVPMHRAGNMSDDFLCNFYNCPHCEARNDVWILVKPVKEETKEHMQHVREAYYFHSGVWPRNMTSGIMFWKGSRITQEQFEDMER